MDRWQLRLRRRPAGAGARKRKSRHNQESTDNTGTRYSMHYRRISISARTEKQRSHAMGHSPFRVSSMLLTTARRWQWKRMKSRRYYSSPDQHSYRMDTGPSERTSTQGRRHAVSSAQTRYKWQRAGPANEALEYSSAETTYKVCKVLQTRTLGSRMS